MTRDRFARELRGFGPVGIAAIVVIAAGQLLAPLGALLALLWTYWSHTPWREIGFVKSRSWLATVAGGAVFGVLFKLVMKAIVMPILGANPTNQAYHYLAGNTSALPAAVLTMVFVAGFGEETVFRGYMFERLGKVLGQSTAARIVTVVASASIFGSLHYFDQGLAGVQQAIITGLVFGTVYAFTGQIWMLMCAHAAFDLTAVTIIYLDLEAAVSHWFFR